MTNIIDGLFLLYTVYGCNDHCVYAEHDEIMVGIERTKISEADHHKLQEMGWHYVSDYGGYRHFT